MSNTLVMLLDREIPRKFLGRELLVYRENDDRPAELYIENISYILSQNNVSKAGYSLDGCAYHFWRTNGELFYVTPVNKYAKKGDISNYEKEYQWVHDTIQELQKLAYETKIFIGRTDSDTEEKFEGDEKLHISKLLNLETTLRDNVLYTVTI